MGRKLEPTDSNAVFFRVFIRSRFLTAVPYGAGFGMRAIARNFSAGAKSKTSG